VDLGLSVYNPQLCWDAVLNVNNNLSSAVDSNALGGDPLTAATKNNFEIKDIRLTYLNLDGSVFSPTEVVALSGLVPAAGTAGICVELCSPNAAVKLHSSPPVELRIQLQFDGALVSGEQLQSSQIDFPISYVKNSCTGVGTGNGVGCPGTGTCPQGTVAAEQFPPCSGNFGQDGTGFNCVVPSADGG
jgi:hypothetical protein